MLFSVSKRASLARSRDSSSSSAVRQESAALRASLSWLRSGHRDREHDEESSRRSHA
jgi:hypothetical protein